MFNINHNRQYIYIYNTYIKLQTKVICPLQRDPMKNSQNVLRTTLTLIPCISNDLYAVKKNSTLTSSVLMSPVEDTKNILQINLNPSTILKLHLDLLNKCMYVISIGVQTSKLVEMFYNNFNLDFVISRNICLRTAEVKIKK